MNLSNETFNEGISWLSHEPYIGYGIFTNNINYLIKQNSSKLFKPNQLIYWFNQSIFDYNVYFSQKDNGLSQSFPTQKLNQALLTLEQWQNQSGHDVNSKIINPKFVDVATCNFNLTTENNDIFSLINFEPLNLSDVGPRF